MTRISLPRYYGSTKTSTTYKCRNKPTRNILDLIYTESLQIKVHNVFSSTYISDHRLVGIELQMKRQLGKPEPHKTRNYKEFTPLEELELAVEELEKELTRTLDELAPLADRRKNSK